MTAVAGQADSTGGLTRGEPTMDGFVPEPEVTTGTTQNVEVQLQNTGDLDLGSDRSTVTTAYGVTFDVTDEGPFDVKSSKSALGTINGGQTALVTQRIDVPDDLDPGKYEIEVEVEYQYTYQTSSSSNVVYERSGSEDITLTLVVADEPRFNVSDLEETLAVGYEGEITGELENTGSQSVDDAVLVVEPMTDSIIIEDTRYALPTLESGEAASFRYPADVSGQSDSGARQLRFSVEYTDDNRETQTSPPMSQRVVVDENGDEFSLEGLNTTVRQGETSDFTLEITNERPETLSNIDANLYTDDPLDTNDDDAFVPELAPNETATVAFDIVASGDATTELHPVELDFQYDTERGDTQVSDVYQYPVTVEESQDDGGSGISGPLIGIVALLGVGGIGLLVWRRAQ